MKNVCLVSFVLAFVVCSMSLAKADNDQPVNSKVKEVTVFLNRAEVTNAASTNLKAGNNTLVFEELSTKLVQQSIQVRANGNNLTIMSVKHRINYLRSQQKAKKIEELEASLEMEKETLARLLAQKKVLTDEEKMILENSKVGGSDNGVSAQRLKEIADFYRVRLTDINNQIIDLNKKIGKQQDKVNKTQQQITEENKNANKPTSEIIVVVKADASTTASFEISYIVLDAGWQPVYDIRAKDSKSPVQLSYRANVFQNTGVDWNNVKITLSTGNPAVGGNKPTLNPWYVDFYTAAKLYSETNQSQVSNMRSKTEKKKAAYELEDVVDGEVTTVADLTEVQENVLSTEFEITIPYSIPSDGKPQLVDVQNHDISTQYAHSAVPKLDKDAFLMARLIDWEKLSLLSGTANVYFEGSFVGETYLDANNTKDTLSVSLGRDKRVVIEREKIKDYTSKKVFGSNIKEEIGYEISIRNTKRERISILIEEQVPVSRNNKIEVALIEATGATFDPITGKVTWRINIEPQQTRKLVLKFSLKYPKNMQIAY